MSQVSIDELNAFFANAFDAHGDNVPDITSVTDGTAHMSLSVTDIHIRPPGYINGPTQMALADHAAYVAVFTRYGVTPMAVTSNLNIDFLRPCIGKALIAEATLLKAGKTLAVVNVDLRGDGQDKPASRATVTYALPK